MENINTKIKIGMFTLIMFLMSLILLFNDAMNYFFVSITLTTISFIGLSVLVFRKEDEESIYMRKLNKILKTYDSSLVYSDNDYKLENEHIIFVKNFSDIAKSSDELNEPIIFINENNSCVFLLKEGDELLTYVMKKNVDIVSNFELKLNRHIYQYENDKYDQKILDNIDKTTLIQLKNNKIYKVSPIKKD